jgi:hypothetical protein
MPPQVFYSINKTNSSFFPMEADSNLDLPLFFQMAGINETIKMVSFPLSLNTLVVRLENIADLYDKDAQTVYLNEFKELLEKMWLSVNSDSNAGVEIDIQEMSLTANMKLEQMEEERIKWRTVDDFKEQYEQKVAESKEDID